MTDISLKKWRAMESCIRCYYIGLHGKARPRRADSYSRPRDDGSWRATAVDQMTLENSGVASYGALVHVTHSTSKPESQLSNYRVVCEISWCRCQQLTALSISTAFVTKLSIEQLLHPAMKSTVSAPWHNFNLCPSSQQILATPLLEKTLTSTTGRIFNFGMQNSDVFNLRRRSKWNSFATAGVPSHH